MAAPYRNPWRRLWYAISLPERGDPRPRRHRWAASSTRARRSCSPASSAARASTRRPRRTRSGSRSRPSGASSRQEPPEVSAQEITKRKAAGNVVELGSIAAFGFSPLWLLAAASDVVHGSRVYLAAFVDELKRAGVLAEEREIGSVDELLETLESASGRTARLHRHPAARAGRAALDARRVPRGRLGPPRPAGARLALPRAPRGGGAGARLAPRGLGRDGHGVPALGEDGDQHAPGHPVPGGLGAAPQRGLRRLRAARRRVPTRGRSPATSTRSGRRGRSGCW